MFIESEDHIDALFQQAKHIQLADLPNVLALCKSPEEIIEALDSQYAIGYEDIETIGDCLEGLGHPTEVVTDIVIKFINKQLALIQALSFNNE